MSNVPTAGAVAEKAERDFLVQDAEAAASAISAADVENVDLPEDEQVGADFNEPTAADRAFGLATSDAREDENDYSHGDGPPPQVVAAAVSYGASEAEDYALRDPR